MGRKNKKERIIGVYTIHGVKNKSAVKIKHLETGKIGPDQRITDTMIHRYDIEQYISAEVYACNITDVSLMSSRRQPMLNIVIAMSKPLKTAILCSIFLFFNIEDDVKTKEHFLNGELDGKFSLEIYLEGEYRKLDHGIDVFPGNNKIIDMLETLTKSDAMIEVLKELADVEEAKIASKYVDDLKYFSVPTDVISLKDYKIDVEYDSISDDDYDDYDDESDNVRTIEV